MNQFRFAFLVMAADHDSSKDIAKMEEPSCRTIVVGVNSIEDACTRAQELVNSGTVNKIELCGAFGIDGARKVHNALGGNVPVGYIVDY